MAAWLFVCLGLPVFLLALAPSASASQVTYPDRESAYAPEVANVTHSPWSPRAGDDVTVQVRLASDAPVPDQVALLYCRVEPVYVCGLPFFMSSNDDDSVWTGVMEWDEDFFLDETVHVGYNVTLRYQGDDGTLERIASPMGNYWVPETYPDDSEGIYFFLRYTPRDTHESGAPGLLSAALVLVGVVAVSAAVRGRDTRRS